MIQSAVLLAAGEGSRLRPFTQDEAKPFLPVFGVPAIQFVIDQLAKSGVRHFVVNVHHCADRARTQIRDLDFHGGSHRISDESNKLLGSGGALRQAISLLEPGSFFYANADRLFATDLRRLAAAHEKLRFTKGVQVTLGLFRKAPEGADYREILIDEAGGLVIGLGEKKAGAVFFMGMAVLQPEAVLELPIGEPSDFVKDVLMPAIPLGNVGFTFLDGPWLDMDSPRLWRDTHGNIIKHLENNSLPPDWAKRISGKVIQVQPGIWRDRGLRMEKIEAVAPCYLGRLLKGPIKIGPNSVVYDNPSATLERLEDGIAYGGHWKSTPS